jgi:hypothetical protein
MPKKLNIRLSQFQHLWIILGIFLLLPLWAQQKFDVSDAPDALSRFHTESPGLKNCDRCHNDDLEVQPAKCLTCHKEIASRISQGRGYHRDKGEDCVVCHSEHQGSDAQLILLDTEDFDHEETGTVLRGVHKQITDCRQCHRKNNTIPRQKSWSYLLTESGCQGCHASPHPGQQQRCQTCHSQTSWHVDIWNPGDLK